MMTSCQESWSHHYWPCLMRWGKSWLRSLWRHRTLCLVVWSPENSGYASFHSAWPLSIFWGALAGHHWRLKRCDIRGLKEWHPEVTLSEWSGIFLPPAVKEERIEPLCSEGWSRNLLWFESLWVSALVTFLAQAISAKIQLKLIHLVRFYCPK